MWMGKDPMHSLSASKETRLKSQPWSSLPFEQWSHNSTAVGRDLWQWEAVRTHHTCENQRLQIQHEVHLWLGHQIEEFTIYELRLREKQL